jgi:hypothetical protein
MPNTALVIDIVELFQKTFGSKPYVVPDVSITHADSSGPGYRVTESANKAEKEFTNKGSLIKEQYRGVEIMLPIKFFDGKELLMYLPYCVIGLEGSKTIIETPLAERVGSVKEQFNIDDYVFNVKGFLIGEDRKFPEEQLDKLRELFETKKAVRIDNALTNIFLSNKNLEGLEQSRVVLYRFSLQEVQGGREHVRPFVMMFKSDTVFTLELEENLT